MPRRLTPASTRAVPATPLRAAAVSSPWDLAELTAPAAPSVPFNLRPANGASYTAAEIGQLREVMQEQQVRAVADARRAGYDEGRAVGRAEAQKAADQRVADTVAALQAAITSVTQHEEAYVGILEENLTALACAISRQVLQREVQLDPSSIRELVHAGLAEFPQETALRVRLNPLDHALLASDPAYREITWVADARVVRGGCVVEGRDRIVDGRLDVALEQVFRVLTGVDA